MASSSNLEVSLELDRLDRTYRPGEVITGRVVVRPTVALSRCKVRLAVYWRTSGKGDVDQGAPTEYDLEVDESAAGSARSFPLSIPAPDGPPSFMGTLIHLDWILQAVARTSAGSAEAEEDFVLFAARTTVLDGVPRGKARSRKRATVPQLGTLTAAAFLAAAGALGMGLGVNFGEAWMCFCGLPGVGLALCALALVPGALAAKRLGPLTLEVLEEVAPGERLRVALSFKPPGVVALNGINVTLRAEEGATTGSGSGRITKKHQVWRGTAMLSGPTTVTPSGFMGEVELLLPPDAPASFASAQNSIRWALRVEVDIPSWPDWSVELPIVVLPGGAAVVPTVRRTLAIQPRQRCPFCRDAIAAADPTPVVSCPGCETVLHEACWAELGRCPTRGCGRERPRLRAR